MKPSDLVDSALAAVTEGCVILRNTHTQNLRWANSSLTTNGDIHAQDLTVVAIESSEERFRLGVASGQAGDTAAAEDLAARALQTCRSAPAVPGAHLPAGDDDRGFEQAPETVADSVSDAMTDAVRILLDAPYRQFGYAEAETTTTYMATSAGTRLRHVQPALRFEACARGDQTSTWWGTTSLDDDFAVVVRRQSAALNVPMDPGSTAPGRHRVLLSPSAVADLVLYLAWSTGGRDAVEGQSVFAKPGGGTKLGETLTSRAITLFADPAYSGVECCDRVVVEADGSMESVFDNGLPLSRQDLIRDGVLTALRASRPTAQQYGLQPTYLADNLILTDALGSGTHEDLLARTDDAILITCLWYIREVDRESLLLTGLTRDGVYRVRDGQIVGALPNFRFNVSVPEVLANISDASLTEPCLPREWADYFTRAAMPGLCVENFNLSSVSDAW